ncbi:F-box domain, FBD domain, Leucine-rich repeat domain, L domain-like protein [Artemisia annua]|uniref:F-box domain, FBD domain, Leucine-rich repeat domain, L domain-like protein n=1 Tax=Artemisia annua TaxID=35608 RepID=A0A2U1PFN5_ARTAN|nr:F-box domain, FBD domain, Leucine-rich repeat domain, L domain-like protein [Artemisia annua]
MAFELDLMIQYLSRSDKVKNLVLKIDYPYKLPSSFFSLEGLELLELTNCDFKPLLKFNGFSMLKSLKFSNVTIASDLLQTLLSSCPLLMDVYLNYVVTTAKLAVEVDFWC